MPLVNLLPNTDEWHEFRRHHLGASDAAVIMGLSSWRTPFDLWEEKLGLSFQNEKRELNPWMLRGIELEPEARDKFCKEQDLYFEPAIFTHPEYEWMSASLDGISFDEKMILEIKCPGKKDHQLALEDKIPPKYYPQVQHQLAVTGADVCYYYSYDGIEGITLEIYPDKEYIEKLIEIEKEFWRCVKQFEVPNGLKLTG